VVTEGGIRIAVVVWPEATARFAVYRERPITRDVRRWPILRGHPHLPVWFVEDNQFTIDEPIFGEPFTVTTNSRGMRGPEPAVPKPPGVFRVFCVGGSTTWSMASDGETWPDVMGRVLGAEVVNAGIPGAVSFDALACLSFEGLVLEPDVVIWYSMGNDGPYLGRVQRWPAYREWRRDHYYGDGEPVFLRERWPDSLFHSATIAGLAYLFDGRFRDVDIGGEWPGMGPRDQESPIAGFDDTVAVNVRAMDALCRSIGARLIVMVGSESDAEDDYALFRDALIEAADEAGVCVADMRLAVPRDAVHRRDEMHLTPAGHGLLGRAVARFIERNEP